MELLLVLAATVFFDSVMCQYLLKKSTDTGSRVRKVQWQFFFCFLMALMLAGATQSHFVPTQVALVAIYGVVNAIAAYAYWRALAISQSKTALFIQGDDLFALLLGAVFLGEFLYLKDAPVFLGVVICFLSGFLLLYEQFGRRSVGKDASGLLVWVGVITVVSGAASFLMRSLGLQNLSSGAFLSGWYGGSFLGSFLLRRFCSTSEVGRVLQVREVASIAFLSLGIFGSMWGTYWALTLAPLALVRPVLQVSKIILPLLMGLYVFNERAELPKNGWIAILLAFVGAAVLLTGFLSH